LRAKSNAGQRLDIQILPPTPSPHPDTGGRFSREKAQRGFWTTDGTAFPNRAIRVSLVSIASPSPLRFVVVEISAVTAVNPISVNQRKLAIQRYPGIGPPQRNARIRVRVQAGSVD
jgi:hypothetical protein